MLDPNSSIKAIYTVGKLIYEQVELVKANKAQCKRLTGRIAIVTEIIKELEKVPDKERYTVALNGLVNCLNDCLTFIKQFSGSSKWYRYVLKTGTYKEKFEAMSNELQSAVQQLDLGLNAQQIINRDQDKADQAQDYQAIQANQDEIIQLNQEANQHLQKLDMQQREQHEILVQQLASMKLQIQNLNIQPVKAKKPPIDPKLLIQYFDLAFDKKLAEGSFGKVYLGQWQAQEVAIKTLEGQFSKEEEAQFIREVDIMSRLRNAHVTQLYGACLEQGRACLVMEHLTKGSLYDVLRKETFSPEQQRSIGLEIARGLYYLHSQGVLHRDLKSANVLLNKHGEAKLADFGLSKTRATSIQSIHQESIALAWQAPECFERGNVYTEKSDIYSYGVVLWEIMTGQEPYAKVAHDQLIDHIKAGKREAIPETIPPVIAQLIKRCWSANPAQRPELTDVIQQLESLTLRPASPPPERLYEEGIKYEQQKDFESALKYYRRASDKGYARATTNLGLFHLKGLGGLQADKQQAFQQFEASAKAGHPRAMVNAATMLEHGDGIKKDLPAALKWYQEAYKNGDKSVAKKIERLQILLEESKPEYQGFAASQRFSFK